MKPLRIETYLLRPRHSRALGRVAVLGGILLLVPVVPRAFHAPAFTVLAFDSLGVIGFLFVFAHLFVASLYVTVVIFLLLAPYLIATFAMARGRDLTAHSAFWYSTMPFTALGIVLFFRLAALSSKKPQPKPGSIAPHADA